jgi:hypothetical protein
MAISLPSSQQVNASHLVAGVTGALAIHRVTKKIHISPVKRVVILAVIALAIAYWHRRANSPATRPASNDERFASN